MSDRRRRDGGPTDRGPDDQADRGAWPGKRSMVSTRDDGVASRWPGKRSVTQDMRMGRQTTATGRPLRSMGEIAQDTIDYKDAGQPLDAGLRKLVEPQVGVGLDDVRVHTDDRAAAGTAAIEARAFTFGKDVFLGPNEQPTDVALMAHELTHVAQQSPEPRRQVAVGAQDHPAEREADAVAGAVTSGRPATDARIVDDGATPLAGQMTRSELMTKLHDVAVQTASASGPDWQAADCSYIDDWFSRHATTPAAQLEAMLRRFTGLSAPATANDYVAPVGTRLANGIARWRGGQDISGDLAAAGVAADAPPAVGGTGAPTATAQAKHAAGAFDAGSPAAIAHELGDGQALDANVAAKVGDAYGASFSNVRVHTDGVAARMASDQHATAFAVGEHVAFSPGAYQPNTPHGDALIAHELAHVVQQDHLGPAAVQRKKIDEDSVEPAEVEADQAATGFMARVWGGAKTAVRKISEVATKSQMQRCSGNNGVPIPTDPFVAKLHAKLYATPPDFAGFFGDIAGLNAGRAGDGVVRSGFQTFVTNSKLTAAQAWRAVAYQEYGPDNLWPLPVKNFADGVDAGKFASTFPPSGADALRTYCVLEASKAADGTGNVMADYRNQFNARFDSTTYAGFAVDFDPALDSKGPRTPRARHIFLDLYKDPATKTAYDTNAPAGFRNMVDTLVGPDGTNLIASPRLQALRAALNGAPAAAPNTAAADYTALVGTITPLAQALDARDRQELQRSHSWRLASDAKITGPVDVKNALWDLITTSRSAAPVGPVVPPGPVVAPPAPPVPNPAQNAFLAGIHITAPASPSNATLAEHPLTFQVRGPANPALGVSRKIVVEPAAQVIEGSPNEQAWPDTAVAVDQTVTVDPQPTAGPSTVFTAKLTMPPLTTATFPEKTVNVTVFDKRLDWFKTNITPGLRFVDDNDKTPLASGGLAHYTGKQCPIEIKPALAGGAANPGLSIEMDGEIKKGAAATPIARVGFGQRAAVASLFQTILQEPAVPPAVPEDWELTIRFYSGSAAPVVHTIVWPFKIAKSRAGNIASDTLQMTHDNDWLNLPIATAGSLLNDMNTRGGHHARVANAVATGALKVRACFMRSDSADQIVSILGAAGPVTSKVAYAMGAVDAPGTAANTLIDNPGAAGWRWPAHPDTVFLNASPHPGGAHRTVAALGDFLAHEGIHAADRIPPGSWGQYQTEFRAYWIMGVGVGVPSAFDPTMSGLGPKAPRARQIFTHLYGSSTYPWVKPNYDQNTAGFRELVDNYLFPDGINLALSGQLTDLRSEIEGYAGAAGTYPAKKAAVIAKYGLCSPADKTEVKNNRDWRDLVETKFVVPVERDEIKDALGIPR